MFKEAISFIVTKWHTVKTSNSCSKCIDIKLLFYLFNQKSHLYIPHQLLLSWEIKNSKLTVIFSHQIGLF